MNELFLMSTPDFNFTVQGPDDEDVEIPLDLLDPERFDFVKGGKKLTSLVIIALK